MQRVFLSVIGVGILVAGGLGVYWVNSGKGDTIQPSALETEQQSAGTTVTLPITQTTASYIDPSDYVGEVPAGVDLETYPRMVPWEIYSIVEEEETTVLMLYALSHACVLPDGEEAVTEIFDRVEVSEGADVVTIETWLGAPLEDGFWPGCLGMGLGISVKVKLEKPLGNRELVDPACELDRHAKYLACKHSKLIGATSG